MNYPYRRSRRNPMQSLNSYPHEIITTADAIFARAGIPKQGNEIFHHQAVVLLSQERALLSYVEPSPPAREQRFTEATQQLLEELILMREMGAVKAA
jgi:hypothetical protein